jgi:hypothetical protein
MDVDVDDQLLAVQPRTWVGGEGGGGGMTSE